MKIIKYSITLLLIIGYVVAAIVQSDFIGNILSPMIAIEAFFIIYKAFYLNKQRRSDRIIGFLLSMGTLTWVLSDVLWAVYDLLLHYNPTEVAFLYSYALTNVFFALSITFYLYKLMRKWNSFQVILDSIVIAFFVLEIIWIAYLGEEVKNILRLRRDWISTVCIILDLMIIMWIIILFMRMNKNNKLSFIIILVTFGLLLFSVTDLVYYYQYFFGTYEPNRIIDLLYLMTFVFIAAGALLEQKHKVKFDNILGYSGRKSKGYYLLIAPVLLIILKGLVLVDLLHFISVLLVYFILSNFIQRNIFKEELLRKEKEQNNELEKKVLIHTSELEEKNRILKHLLDQDFVTGLKNRRFLLSYLDEIISNLETGETILLLFVDINRFKLITTMYGHCVGDMIMYEMAEKLNAIEKLKKRALLTSYGNDTFIFTAVGNYDYKKGYVIAQKLIELGCAIYQIEEYQIKVTINIGISLYPYDAATKEELIKHADIAMTQSRQYGCNYVQEYDADLSKVIFRKNTLEIMLRKVLFHQEFMLYYQPQLVTEDRKLIGFEALLRWRTAMGEMINPGEFIPVAEETGYIIPIGEWVIKMAMKQLAIWNSILDKKLMMSINISLRQLGTSRFMEGLKEELKRQNVDPKWIDLEITESIQLQENQEILRIFKELREIGITISIDDFGTGYSSLSYLKNLPIDRIKLAKELIDSIHKDKFDYELVKAIILLSKAKAIRVIAEGVETKEQWDVLKELHCDEVQGYYFGKPEPVETIEKSLKDKCFYP